MLILPQSLPGPAMELFQGCLGKIAGVGAMFISTISDCVSHIQCQHDTPLDLHGHEALASGAKGGKRENTNL